jgi:hypothetical protein
VPLRVGRLHYALKDYEMPFRLADYATLIDDEFLERSWKKAKAFERLNRHEEAIVVTAAPSN